MGVRCRSARGPEVLEYREIPVPKPRPDWVLIRIKAFGLNRSELHTRLGHSGNAIPFPRVLGIECVGEVVDARESDLQPGQQVAATMGGMGRRFDDSFAEYTLVPPSQVFPVETTLDWADFPALPLSYLTAWGFVVESIGVRPGQGVRVRGATSSVGLAAINILRQMDCTIIATTRSEAKGGHLLASGATHSTLHGRSGEQRGSRRSVRTAG